MPPRFTTVLVADQSSGTPYAAACDAAWAAAAAPLPAPHCAPCGFVALAAAALLAEGDDLAAAPAAAREARVLARAAAEMRAAAAARRAYAAARPGDFGPGARGDEARAGAAAFIAAPMAGQWEVAARVAAPGAPRVCFLRVVRRPVARAPARVWTYEAAWVEQTARDDPALVREWFAEEAPFAAAGEEFFLQSGAALESLDACVARAAARGEAELPPVIIDYAVGHYCAAIVSRDGGALRRFESISDVPPEGVPAAFCAALVAAHARLVAAGAAAPLARAGE